MGVVTNWPSLASWIIKQGQEGLRGEEGEEIFGQVTLSEGHLIYFSLVFEERLGCITVSLKFHENRDMTVESLILNGTAAAWHRESDIPMYRTIRGDFVSLLLNTWENLAMGILSLRNPFGEIIKSEDIVVFDGDLAHPVDRLIDMGE